jgi:catechol 2,3-dioxygenase-like lactoylglutathione lyase family enzyme
MILRMFDHLTIRVSDRARSRAFYELLLGPVRQRGEHYDEWHDFGIAEGAPTRNLHVAFIAASRAEVDERWRRAIDAGWESGGEPGARPQYGPEYYGGFVLDPDGNSAEVVHNGTKREADGLVDHLWIGVRDLAAQKRFYRTIGPTVGVEVYSELDDRFHVRGGNRTFALVADGREPTTNLHLAFPVATDEEVAEFHRIATAAGYRDNGAPGERPQYHSGYVGAFVLDPDGNNIEAVNHNRPGSA